MAIELKKRVARRVTICLDNRITARSRDVVTVTLYPEGTIGFRANRSREEHLLPLATAYRMAIHASAMEAYERTNTERRANGLKPLKRKPVPLR